MQYNAKSHVELSNYLPDSPTANITPVLDSVQVAELVTQDNY